MVFGVVLLMLPLGISGIGFLQDSILLQRSRQHLQHCISAAGACLAGDQLSEGQIDINADLAINRIRDRFVKQMPAMLCDRLTLLDVSVIWRKVTHDPDHWQGGNQPTHLPAVLIRAIFVDRMGNRIPLRDSIELLLD